MFKALTAIVALAASASVMAQGDVTLEQSGSRCRHPGVV